MLTTIITKIIEASTRYALLVILLCLTLSGFSLWYASTHFKIDTDVNKLLSADLDWRKREAEVAKLFPQKNDLLVIVVDGKTPEDADDAAARIAASASSLSNYFKLVARPDALPFFHQNGLLFLSDKELGGSLEKIISAQPLLGAIAKDTSLRGLFNAFSLYLTGVQMGQAKIESLNPAFATINQSINDTLAGHNKGASWQSMMSTAPSDIPQTRKFIITQPVLDFTALSPGLTATNALHGAIAKLNLGDVRVRFTGPVPLSDQEFASIADGTQTATILSVTLVLVILFLALRSMRLVIPILITLGAGLVITLAFALMAVHALNLISVAFAVMFIGIAVDFGIQLGVRYRDQHHAEPDHNKAMTRTAQIIARPLAMAAIATAIGFFAFLPTDYTGVAELGLIAGMGMVIAFILNITLLPAMLKLSKPPAEREAIGYAWAGIIDDFLIRKRKACLIAILLGTIVAGGLAYHTYFDFDPLNLKDPHTESMQTLIDIMHDPMASPYTIDILRADLKSADALARELEKLPQVSHVMTLSSFVPENMNDKIQVISDSAMVLLPSLSPPTTLPAPRQDEIIAAMQKTATLLRQVGGADSVAIALADTLDKITAQPDSNLIQNLHKNMIVGLAGMLNSIKTLLSVQPFTIEAIPHELRQDWIAGDGRALITVYPKGNPRDHERLIAFADAVRSLAPDAIGAPVAIDESGRTITRAFVEASVYAIVAISILALLILRNIRDTLFLILPLLLACTFTLGTMVVIHLPLNFANIIALPLLLSLGVSYAIYFITYWRSGNDRPLQSSMARAVLFSAATTLVAFGSLSLSSHLGTSSMGLLLTIALFYCLFCTFFVLPVLLGRAISGKSDSTSY